MNPKMPPPSLLHSNFFSSLKQVEKRLKLENPTPKPVNLSSSPQSQQQQEPVLDTNYTSVTESLSTPIYLHTDQEPNNDSVASLSEESSEPPLAFLSPSLHSSPTNQDPPPKSTQFEHTEAKSHDIDDIEHLIQLLGLSNVGEGWHGDEEEVDRRVCCGGGCCGCEGDFYEKIVGVKGPKCKTEVKRLEGWIRCFLGNGGGREERREPLRLAFLLLGKAAFELEGGEGGNLVFPTSIDEYLKFDPPRE